MIPFSSISSTQLPISFLLILRHVFARRPSRVTEALPGESECSASQLLRGAREVPDVSGEKTSKPLLRSGSVGELKHRIGVKCPSGEYILQIRATFPAARESARSRFSWPLDRTTNMCSVTAHAELLKIPSSSPLPSGGETHDGGTVPWATVLVVCHRLGGHGQVHCSYTRSLPGKIEVNWGTWCATVQ